MPLSPDDPFVLAAGMPQELLVKRQLIEALDLQLRSVELSLHDLQQNAANDHAALEKQEARSRHFYSWLLGPSASALQVSKARAASDDSRVASRQHERDEMTQQRGVLAFELARSAANYDALIQQQLERVRAAGGPTADAEALVERVRALRLRLDALSDVVPHARRASGVMGAVVRRFDELGEGELLASARAALQQLQRDLAEHPDFGAIELRFGSSPALGDAIADSDVLHGLLEALEGERLQAVGTLLELHHQLRQLLVHA